MLYKYDNTKGDEKQFDKFNFPLINLPKSLDISL